MNDQPASPNCPDCGQPLPEDSTHELCPACLLRQALESRTVADPNSPPLPATPPPTPDEIADKFPGFEITECLGRGGMGVVYKARQISLDRMVAIKILAPERVGDEKFAARFATEAQTLAKLSHPNIVTVFDHGETGGLYYIVMEFVDGVNLRDLLREGKLDPKQALSIVPPICEALQFAHDKGIVHRDIKPENLLLDRDGRIKIADFGIASLVGSTGDPAGTPPYMAPEQGGTFEVDHRADIYALGAVLYETLTGERPGDVLSPPSQKVAIDVRIDDIVLRALNKEPSRRYRTADEFRTMVQTVSGTQSPPAPSASTTTAPAPPASNKLSDPRWTRAAGYGMVGMGILNFISPAFALLLFILWRAGIPLLAQFHDQFPGPVMNSFPGGSFLFGATEIVLVFAVFAFSVAIGVVALIGGRHMLNGTSRTWVVAGAIACCFSPALWILGVAVGIASLVLVISNSSTSPAPTSPGQKPDPATPRFSRLAIAAAALHGLVFFFLLLILLNFGSHVTAGHSGPRMAPSVLALAIPFLLFSIPATVLAWIAAAQIRRSDGKLRGKRLAVLAGMLLPCLLAIPVLAFGAAIVHSVITRHPNSDDATNIILFTLTMATFAALALLGLRTCFRHLRGTAKNVLSKPVRITAAALLALWLAVSGLLWVQRPQAVGTTITSQSPDRPFTITASTLHRMHVFGPDLLTYHFDIVGLNGTVHISKEILVPLEDLANNPESYSDEDYFFNSTDAIEWAKQGDNITATIKIQDVTVHKITITPEGRVSTKTSD